MFNNGHRKHFHKRDDNNEHGDFNRKSMTYAQQKGLLVIHKPYTSIEQPWITREANSKGQDIIKHVTLFNRSFILDIRISLRRHMQNAALINSFLLNPTQPLPNFIITFIFNSFLL